jgi:RHH-type proline utilization regulon transcriptional repressor/proline dehydrogenase/delta 1-pyrroline-5-carboxylate dehydrogenase
MQSSNLEPQIIARGREFFSSISGESVSLFNKARWTGKVMDWCMKNEGFKVQLFRFVDVLPSLTTGKLLTSHIREYFGGEGDDVPAVLKWGAKSAGIAGMLGASVINATIRYQIQDMAKQFIVGENTKTAVRNLAKLRKDGFAFVVDVLGEATVNDEEAERYVATYLELLDELQDERTKWTDLGGGNNGLDWGHAPRVNVAVKPTGAYPLPEPQNFEGAVEGIKARLARVYEKVIAAEGFLCIDMESYKYKDITLEVYRRLRSDPKFRHYPHLAIVLQAYLRDTDKDLDDLLKWARENQLPISIRLVKGAYWDYETVLAKQHGWEIPVWTQKPETDAAFERQTCKILENHDICHFACASHNIRSIAVVMEAARALNVPEERYEFQVLYGMAEPVRKGLQNVARRIRLYCPYGELVPGMAYLVRRLLENTANESFLRQSFAEEHEITQLLEDPRKTLERTRKEEEPAPAHQPAEQIGPISPIRPIRLIEPFRNEPAADFTRKEVRDAFPRAIAEVRKQTGRTYPLFIGGKDVATPETLPSVNPANPDEVIGRICQAGKQEVGDAIAAARKAFPAWRDTPSAQRAEYLLKAAAILRRRIYELSAWQILEVGKQWDQAYADVAEAIDFLEYYAREMIRRAEPRRCGSSPGEVNLYFYEPKGIAGVIAPWNFPLAISCGMAGAAIVTGNPVVFKPSGFSSVIGYHLVEAFREAGLPAGVFNYIPGRGGVIGDFLVDHPDISLIAFTGSVETGCRIIERAAKVHPGQAGVKKIISEMGGKNAIIIDDDADLDEAVPLVLYSAFGFQGQKCSACSRLIVLDSVYDRFIERLIKTASGMKIGPAEDPRYSMGPVADRTAQKSILEYIEIGKKEGKLLYSSPVPDKGFYVPLTIIGGIKPDHRIAQEEVFGPVLAVMRAKDFDQAIEWANSTRFALTGGVFSRSPRNLERARREFRVGNLYLNRNCTGALVDRQPFGGSGMSGVGTKAGGPDYLPHFMDPRVVTENTMRRGFTPIREDDEKIV